MATKRPYRATQLIYLLLRLKLIEPTRWTSFCCFNNVSWGRTDWFVESQGRWARVRQCGPFSNLFNRWYLHLAFLFLKFYLAIVANKFCENVGNLKRLLVFHIFYSLCLCLCSFYQTHFVRSFLLLVSCLSCLHTHRHTKKRLALQSTSELLRQKESLNHRSNDPTSSMQVCHPQCIFHCLHRCCCLLFSVTLYHCSSPSAIWIASP